MTALDDTNVAILLAPAGTEEVEFTEPRQAVEDAGANVDAVGPEAGEAQTVESDLNSAGTYEVEKAVSDVSADDYDALLVPGGTVGADKLRGDEGTVSFVREFFESEKPVGAICHGPWVLVEADVVEGRTLTSYPSLQTDIRNAGGEWVDEEVVTDGRLVTSRKPDDLDAYCEQVVEVFGESE
ncbi:type 1 glutamine amidotransferase domain-containing protein [Halopelagius longus]|uniref:Protease I n=1 Tax=Halopelagius longus TaxID=1236180 RepID=A0A1H1B4M1_9EURY|nr:type 1 glutamine amidotransferase domain-containing protein [Halopelagius longus]RDI70639.1 type 1 glutamine amidotransferase [Halopelagius longus]SDQ46853.1 protease I [Halopelagius longus]